MTEQIEDDFHYRDAKYTLAACSAGEPFSPYQLGIQPNMASTACVRGYHVTYGVKDDRLVVAELRFVLVEDEVDWTRVPGPEINGVEPVEEAPGPDWFNNNFLDLDLPVAYDGGLIIGSGYLNEYHLDLDLVTLWKYREVLEIRFEQGRLSEVRDLSELMRPIRQIADEKEAILKAFMEELAPAMRKAESEEERRAIKRDYFATKGDSAEAVFDAEMDDVARQKLAGLIDPAYLEG
jgi:hypothetical protein